MKTFTKAFYFPLLFLFLFNTNLCAEVTQGSSAQQLATQIQGVGITITNPEITYGDDDGSQVGIFTDAISDFNLEVDEGIILTTMTVAESFTTNNSRNFSTFHSDDDNDSDLTGIDASAHFNTIVFEFDVTLDENTRLLLINYQFAAEEYNEYVGTIYNDAFGFFISGGDLNQTYNIARVIDNQTFVTVNNINNYDTVTVNNVNNGNQGARYSAGRDGNLTPVYTNTAFYIDNDQNNQGGNSPIDVEYDGLTHTLHATLDNLTPGETYHFKMAIADTSDAQLNTGVFIDKIRGLREPNICYDYAFKQNGQYITSDYNASTGPYIKGNVIANDTNYPIEVSMYIKNEENTEIVASNILMDIIDINTSQATYKTESVSITETGEIYPTKIDDIDLNVSNSFIKNMPIDSFDAFEYFYTYFSLDPLETELNLPIYSRLTYDLTIPLSATESVTITRSSLIDSDVPICSGDSFYDPVAGIFTAVHNDYYNLDTGGTNPYYNIPTQVTSREGNFKILSLDINNTDQLVGRSTMVAVELVDVGAFHDTEATCTEQSNAISERVWIQIGDIDGNATSAMFDRVALQAAISEARTGLQNGATTLTNSWDFYKNARKNTALRISYNQTNDGNNDLVKITPTLDNGGNATGEYSINFPEIIQAISPPVCAVDMDGISNNVDTIGTWCRNNSNKLTMTEIAICMECVYGYNTKFECSRDNFSMRPEAFLMHLDDQNQTNPTMQSRLTTNYSGVTAAIADANLQELNISAGYNYNIEVNATNHRNNNSVNGYIKSFDSSNPLLSINDKSGYKWEERTGVTPGACNDDSNHSIKMTFYNGTLYNTHTANNQVDTNTSLYEVGEYELRILDTTWTAVDGDTTTLNSNGTQKYLSHHVGSYFLSQNLPDCSQGSNKTYPVGTQIDFTTPNTRLNTLAGCNISSEHTNAHTNSLYDPSDGSTAILAATDLKYNSYDVEFHPYEFIINNTLRLGIGSASDSKGVVASSVTNPFIYMSDVNMMTRDENMSVHFDANITAIGKNGTTGLKNFVKGCYAKPLDLNITKSRTGNSNLILSYTYQEFSSTTNPIPANDFIDFINFGNQDVNVTLNTDSNNLKNSFQKDMNGTLDTRINLNFNRDVNISANPERITFIEYRVDNSNNPFSADLTTKTAEGNTTINQNVTFYYGRTAARKTRIVCDTGNANCDTADEVLINYEVYCSEITNGQNCIPAILPRDIAGSTKQRVDSRWFTNLDHNITTYGQLINTVDSVNAAYITLPNGITHANGYTSDSVHRYPINNGLPYIADMNDTVPRWLIHDEKNASAITNSHTVIFRARSEWSGEHEADSKTKTDRAQRVNRRTMW